MSHRKCIIAEVQISLELNEIDPNSIVFSIMCATILIAKLKIFVLLEIAPFLRHCHNF